MGNLLTRASKSANVIRQVKPPPLSKTDSNVTAKIKSTSPPPPYKRKTTEDWAKTLNQISGAISSSTWQGEVMPIKPKHAEQHPAARSEQTKSRLPLRKNQTSDAPKSVAEQNQGRLSVSQIIALYNMRRKDHVKWSAENIAQKFAVDVNDIRALLKYTRTYTGKQDPQGHMTAYYKYEDGNVIHRFERD